MMINQHLKTFVKVVDEGSFAKAADALYISTTAIIKQINLFEEELGLTLLVRSRKGVSLTDAGKSVYHDSKYLIQYEKDSISRAKRAETNKYVVRIGVSVLTATGYLDEILPIVREKNSDLQIQLIPFEQIRAKSNDILENMGRDIDIAIAMCEIIKTNNYKMMPLKYEPIRVAVSVNHPLAKKDILKPEDLYGQNFMMLKRGENTHMDRLRDYIESNHPQINIVDIDYMDMMVFNRCESGMHTMFAIDKWRNKHPLLKILPVEWNHTVPYGMLYSKTPSNAVRRFIDTVEKEYCNKNIKK